MGKEEIHTVRFVETRQFVYLTFWIFKVANKGKFVGTDGQTGGWTHFDSLRRLTSGSVAEPQRWTKTLWYECRAYTGEIATTHLY